MAGQTYLWGAREVNVGAAVPVRTIKQKRWRVPNEEDYETLLKAVRAGKVPAEAKASP